MSKRLTDTEKWKKNWFLNLSIHGKLLWIYCVDNCDHAGICDFSEKMFSYQLDFKVTKEKVNELLGNKIEWITEDCFLITSFIKFQYGDLNPNNRVHRSVIERINSKNNIENKHLISPLEGAKEKDNNKYNEKDNNIINKHELNWKDDYNIYKSEELNAYNLLLNDKDFIEERKKYHPNIDIKLSLEKAHVDFWSTEAGWLYKKKSKTSKIDWKSTYRNALAIKSNQVWGNHGTYKTSVDRVNENQRAILQTGIEAISDLKREREAFGVDSIEAYPINPNLELTYDERPVESVCGDSIGGNDL